MRIFGQKYVNSVKTMLYYGLKNLIVYDEVRSIDSAALIRMMMI